MVVEQHKNGTRKNAFLSVKAGWDVPSCLDFKIMEFFWKIYLTSNCFFAIISDRKWKKEKRYVKRNPPDFISRIAENIV